MRLWCTLYLSFDVGVRAESRAVRAPRRRATGGEAGAPLTQTPPAMTEGGTSPREQPVEGDDMDKTTLIKRQLASQIKDMVKRTHWEQTLGDGRCQVQTLDGSSLVTTIKVKTPAEGTRYFTVTVAERF